MTTTYTSNRTLTLNPVVVRRSGIPLLALLFFAGLLQARAADDTPQAGPLIPLTEASSPAIYGAYMDSQRMVIEDEWKLIVYPKVPLVRLFHLEDDPHEMNDLAGNSRHAPKIQELLGRLQALQRDLNDPLDLTDFKPSLK